MQEIEEIYIDLIRKVYEKFTFFIPMAVAEDENMIGILHYMNLKLDDAFYDKYVDVLLFSDDMMEVHEFVSYKEFMEFNSTKMLNLSNNCAELAILKDTLGKTSFRYIFEKYTEQLVVLNYACDSLVHFFYEHYPESQVDITFLFRQQKLLLQTHINDLEKVILSKGKRIDEKTIIERLVEMFLSLPNVKRTFSNENSMEKKQNDEIIDNNIEESISENTKKENETKIIKPLRDYLKHNNKVEIEKLIKEHYSSYKGVSLRYLIQYLEDKSIIIINYGDQTKLYNSFKAMLGENIGAYNSIFNIPNFSKFDKKYISKIDSFNTTFKGLI